VMETANLPRPPAAKRVMKYKKARSLSEVQKMADEAMKNDYEDYTAELKAGEVETYCSRLASRGLLIEQWNLDDIGADLAWCGRDGSPTKVHRIQAVVLKGGQYKELPPTDEGVATLIRELIEDHTIG